MKYNNITIKLTKGSEANGSEVEHGIITIDGKSLDDFVSEQVSGLKKKNSQLLQEVKFNKACLHTLLNYLHEQNIQIPESFVLDESYTSYSGWDVPKYN